MPLKPPTADEIKAARAALGLTQARFAGALGVSKRTLEGWEAGASAPALLTFVLAYLREHPEAIGGAPAPAAVPEPKPAAAVKAPRPVVPTGKAQPTNWDGSPIEARRGAKPKGTK